MSEQGPLEPGEAPEEQEKSEERRSDLFDQAAEAAKGQPRKKWPFIVAGVLVGLLIAGVAGAFLAKSWALDHAVEIVTKRAAKYGWSLEVGSAELDWDGNLVMEALTATDEHGGTLEIARLETGITPGDAWDGKRMPDDVYLRGMTFHITRGGIDAIAEIRKKRKDDDDGGGSFPTVHLEEGKISVASGTSVGLVTLDGFAAELARAEEGWHSEGTAQLVLEGRSPVGLRYGLDAVLRESRGRLELALDAPITHNQPGIGKLSMQGLTVEGGLESTLAGELKGIGWVPESLTMGVESVQARSLEFALVKQPEGLWPEAVRVVEPHAKIHFERLVYGPLGQRVPRLVEAYEEAQQRLDPEGWKEREPEYTRLKAEMLAEAVEVVRPDVKAPVAMRAGRDLVAMLQGIDSFEALQAQMKELPGVVLERATVELGIWGGRSFKVAGFDFDTSALLAPRDEQRYEFNFSIRGSEGGIAVELPEEEGAWPTVQLKVNDVALADLFALADQAPPEQLTGTADLDVTVAQNAARLLKVDGIFKARDVGFFIPRVSSEVVRGGHGEVEVHVAYDREADTLTLDKSAVRIGDFEVKAKVTADKVRKADTHVEFRVWTEAIPCDSIGKAIPAGMLPDIERLEIEGGTLSGMLDGRVDLDDWISFRMNAEGFPGECRVKTIAPFDVEALNDPNYTKTYMGRPYTTMKEGITVGQGTDNWISLHNLPGYVPAVMYMTEDARFFDHGGIRIGLVNRAIRLNMEAGKYVYGGSSLTQQLVKNLFLYRRKHLARKLEELLLVWKTEEVVSKERILELYINCIEFGPDVYGLEKASDFYFGKAPSRLSPLEAGYIASLKIKPSRGGKYYTRGWPEEGRWWNKRIKKILVQLSEHGYITPVEVMAASPWTQEFDKPEPGDSGDWRAAWLEHYRQERLRLQREESLRKKREAAEAAEDEDRPDPPDDDDD